MIDVQNINDNRCFKWCLFRYLNPADHNPRIFTKTDKGFTKRLDLKDIKFPVKARDIHKIEKKKKKKKKKKTIGVGVFGYDNKNNVQSMYQKNVVKKSMLTCY